MYAEILDLIRKGLIWKEFNIGKFTTSLTK